MMVLGPSPATDDGAVTYDGLVEVVEREEVARDVVALRLRSVDGTLPGWGPGAHIDLVLPNGLVRQYSLCGGLDEEFWRVAVLKDDTGRGGSACVHEQLQVGTRVTARGARNNFALDEAGSYLFVAGGIGITPLLPMIERAEATGVPWRLVYGGRSREHMAFLDDLEAFGGRVEVHPQDREGLLDLESLLGRPVGGRMLYACGPEALLAAIEARTPRWPSGSVRMERFRAAESTGMPDVAFEVELRDGRVLEVPATRSALDVLEEAGTPIESSCREGTCGSCEVGVLAGEPDHRDAVLTADERASNETMMVCVSRCVGRRLLLDL